MTTAKTCNNCGVFGHLAGACPEPSQCHACGSTAHAVAECPNRDKTCDNCGRVSATELRRDAAARCDTGLGLLELLHPMPHLRQRHPVPGPMCRQKQPGLTRPAVRPAGTSLSLTQPVALPADAAPTPRRLDTSRSSAAGRWRRDGGSHGCTARREAYAHTIERLGA